jgi:hypothetical protein
MGMTNSEMLEELLVKCYDKGIVEEVREEARKILIESPNRVTYEAYLVSYEKIIKKYSKND